jgi:hypothetical protein
LDASTWVELPPQQQDLALSVARRALEARGFAQTGDDSQLLVHRALLTAVGTCAFPQRSILVDHQSADGQATSVFTHIRDQDSVVHTGAGGVHTFALLSSAEELVNHLASLCQWNSSSSTAGLELTVPRQDFTRACDASADGAEADAQRILTAAGGADKASSALAHALATRPRISIVQMLRSDEAEAVQERAFTFIESDGNGWLVSPVNDSADAPVKVKSSSRTEVMTLLRDW